MQAEDAMEWLLTFGKRWVTWREFRKWDTEIKDGSIPIYSWVGRGYIQEVDNLDEMRITEKGLDLIKQRGN